jgi:ethanolamine utilization microcompartment shell protein EutS
VTLVDHRLAAGIVEDALCRVFAPDVVGRLREDSPLSALSITPADAVCIAEAIATAAERGGLVCHLGDADFVGAQTVADLVSAVESGARAAVGP